MVFLGENAVDVRHGAAGLELQREHYGEDGGGQRPGIVHHVPLPDRGQDPHTHTSLPVSA